MILNIQSSLATPCLSYSLRHLTSETEGHLRGAKVAMTVALNSPHLVKALVPVDNAPVDANLKSNFHQYVNGLRDIDERSITKQAEADKILKGYEEVSRWTLKPAYQVSDTDPIIRSSP